MNTKIIGTGSYVPERVVTNDDLADMVDTSDEWIRTRTGIRKRHVSEGEGTAAMAAEASEEGSGSSDERLGRFQGGQGGSWCSQNAPGRLYIAMA